MTKRKAVAISAAVLALAVPLVVHFEGYVPYVYRDPIARLAVCYGHDDQTLTEGRRYTRSECEALLREDLERHAEALDCITAPLSDHQRAALISFSFNVGKKALCSSTLARKANAGDMRGACAELSRWTLAAGKELPGLVRRRAAERALCEGRLRP